MIFSVDGNGTVTVHYPYSGNESANLVMNEKTSLKSSFILDTAPKYEKFYFVTSYQKFDISGLYSGNSEELSVILDVYSKNSEYQIDEFLLNKE